MTTAKAFVIAIRCMEKEKQRLAVQANMYDVQHLDWPSTKGASQRRSEISQAIDIIKEIIICKPS